MHYFLGNKIETVEQISKKSKSSFYYTFSFLPEEKRNAIKTLYAFCRKTDDIVDDDNKPKELKQQELDKWREKLTDALSNKPHDEFFSQIKKYTEKFKIPHEPFYDIISGMELDLNQNRYQTFDELKDYCYKVASTVGLMTIPVFGYKNKSTEEYAVNLGIALQLTNIMRDVKTDAERGRIYLPLDDLEQFKYSEDELLENVYNENFVNLMKYESEKARSFYTLAGNNLQREDRSSLFTARAMEYIYYRLLDKIEEAEFNVFKEKIRVSNINKLFISAAVWLKYKLLP